MRALSRDLGSQRSLDGHRFEEHLKRFLDRVRRAWSARGSPPCRLGCEQRVGRQLRAAQKQPLCWRRPRTRVRGADSHMFFALAEHRKGHHPPADPRLSFRESAPASPLFTIPKPTVTLRAICDCSRSRSRSLALSLSLSLGPGSLSLADTCVTRSHHHGPALPPASGRVSKTCRRPASRPAAASEWCLRESERCLLGGQTGNRLVWGRAVASYVIE